MEIVTSQAATPDRSLASLDPFDDHPAAATIAVHRTGLVRMAIVAAGVGARFEREARLEDPIAWMLAPRRMFDGACAVTACLDRTAFERALVLNTKGAGFGLDADPDLLDDLLDGDEDEPEGSAGDGGTTQHFGGAMPRHDPPIPPRAPRRARRRGRNAISQSEGTRLFTASFVRYDGGGRVLVFVGAVVESERVFRNRLFERFGAIAALGADVREGFDQFDRIASRIISEFTANRLAHLAAEPSEITAEGFDVLAEQRA